MAMSRQLLLALASLTAACRSVPSASANLPRAERPSLVVVISVDQLRADYLKRFASEFGNEGFALLGRGASYDARYPYATTFTGPGHAAIGTGLPPAQTGIVGNKWFERGPQGMAPPRLTYCVDDPRAERVTESGGHLEAVPGSRSYSPVHLSGDSLGDRVREGHPSARVIGVSLKDRAAILMAGRKATAAYWLDEASGRFVTSSYYAGARAAVLGFRSACLTGSPELGSCPHRRWSPRLHLGEALARIDVFDTDATEPFELVPPGLERLSADDYAIRNLTGLVQTPFGDELLLEFAWHVIETEELGARGDPDLLFVSLSSLDYVGHQFGPDSIEVADEVVTLDSRLAAFIARVVGRVGQRVTFVLTSDHGVQSIPAVARARRPGADVGEVDLRHGFAARVEALLRGGAAEPRSATSTRPVVVFEEPALWIDWARVAELGLRGTDAERVRETVRDAVAHLPGVSGAWTSSELLAPCRLADRGAADERCQAVRLSFRADRSGDVIVTLRDGWIWRAAEENGVLAYATTHGQPVQADAAVPLLFWGAGIHAGGAPVQRASPLDVATTLGALLDVQAGRPGAKPLPCVR
jgi:type I phosphodiesterase/nucleotide pyrophosphatase